MSKSFVFKNIVAKEGLPRDAPAGLGAGGPEFKSRRPDQKISNEFLGLRKLRFHLKILWGDAETGGLGM